MERGCLSRLFWSVNKKYHPQNPSVNNNLVLIYAVTQVPYAIAQDLTVSFDGNTSHCEDPVGFDAVSELCVFVIVQKH